MDKINVKFTPQEIEMFYSIITHATHGLGLGYDRNKTKESNDDLTNPIILARNEFTKHIDNDFSGNIPKEVLKQFLDAYTLSCEALDPKEMQTITNYEWEETQYLREKLRNIIEKNVGINGVSHRL